MLRKARLKAGTIRDSAHSLLFAGEDIRYQDAEPAARLALREAAAGRVLGYSELLPEYMRLSEAEQRLREGTLSDKIRKAGRI